jgi:hypothetical protein
MLRYYEININKLKVVRKFMVGSGLKSLDGKDILINLNPKDTRDYAILRNETVLTQVEAKEVARSPKYSRL